MSRRLPVYLLIDTSGSMKGEPISAVNNGLQVLLSSLKSDPYALDTVNISIITFDRVVNVVLPLTPLEDIQLQEIATPESGPTHTGAALQQLCKQVDTEVHISTPQQKGDWMPLLFLLTDGKPSDIQVYNDVIPEVKKRHFASIVACAAGMSAKVEDLKKLTDSVYTLDTMDSATFKGFFKWVTQSIGVGNKSIGTTRDIVLPPPPAEVNMVI
ncbi:MAG: VWA domain-containing protein [Bacteroidales bacterium]|nr:VWA domain-containing protein [Bacteroidales bacterium]